MMHASGQETWQPRLADSQRLCVGCSASDKCPNVWSAPRRGPFNPIGLSLASALVFLLPLVAGTIGVVLARPDDSAVGAGVTFWEVAAALGGLGVGSAAAWLTLPIIRRRFAQVPGECAVINKTPTETMAVNQRR